LLLPVCPYFHIYPDNFPIDQCLSLYLRRAVKQLVENGVVGKKMGRPPALDAQAVAELTEEIFVDDVTRTSKDKQEIAAAIVQKRKAVAEGLNRNSLAIKNTCKKTTMKYVMQIAPDVQNAPSTQSERRFDALQRPVNHVSLSAM
jgi:hypothetical protein